MIAAPLLGNDASVSRSHPLQTTRIVLRGAGRRFGTKTALSPVSIALDPRTVVLFTGHNGSGKTTLLRIAAGTLAPSTGTVEREGAGLYLSPGDGARRHQTVEEAVSFVAGVRGGDVAEALTLAGIDHLAGERIARLSAGQRARATLAVAIAFRPTVLCLDEPTTHLDEQGTNTVTAVVNHLAARGAAVLVATHDVSFLEDRADARFHLSDGRIVSQS